MMIKRIVFPVLLMTIVLLSFTFNSSCRHDPQGLDQLDTVCFQTQILPIIQTSCGISGCHAGGSEGFSLTSYSDLMTIVSAGKASKSKLYEVITSVNGGNMMPPSRPLTKEQRTLILVWIEQGANNNTCTTAVDGGGSGTQQNMDTICFAQNVAPIIQSSCGKTSCHDVTSHKEDYVLTNYNTIMRKGIVPFNPSSSKIYQVTNPGSGEDIMPPSPNPALTAAQRELLRKWIAEGALNSNCPWTTCDTTGIITFSQHLQPIIQNNCIGCHNPSNLSGNVDLSTYAQVKHYSETLRNGTPIILGALGHNVGFTPMPPSGMLSPCQIRTFELWISAGILNN